MPRPIEIMWDYIKQRKFTEIRELIEANPGDDLINAKHPENGRNLPIHLVQITMNKKEAKPRDLLHFILTHSKMNWDFENKKQTAATTLLEAVVVDNDFSVIEGLKDVPGFVLSNNQLTFNLANARLKQTEDLLQVRIKGNKPQSELDETKANIEKWKKVLALVRDLTILHAIKTDNADLFDRLEKSGAKPLDELGEFAGNRLPMFLFGRNQPNPKIEAWRKEQFEKSSAGRDDKLKKAQDNLNRYQFYQKEADRIISEHAAKEIEILNRAAADRQERMKQAIAIMN